MKPPCMITSFALGCTAVHTTNGSSSYPSNGTNNGSYLVSSSSEFSTVTSTKLDLSTTTEKTSVNLTSSRLAGPIVIHIAGEPIKPVSNLSYTYGDIVKTLYPGDWKSLGPLDPQTLCDQQVVAPLSAKGWEASDASGFIKSWFEASRKHPDFWQGVSSTNKDFWAAFRDDVIFGHQEFNCYAHKACPVISCKDVVQSLRIQDPALAIAVVYNFKTMRDTFVFHETQFKLLQGVMEMMPTELKDIVEHFTWREDQSILDKCKQQAEYIKAIINTAVMAAAIFTGGASGVLAGATSAAAAGAASTIGKQLGQRATETLINTYGVGVNALSNVEGGDALAAALCKNRPHAAEGTDEKTLDDMLRLTVEHTNHIRRTLEQDVVSLKNNRPTAVGNVTMIELLVNGTFFLRPAMAEKLLDTQEVAKKELFDLIKNQWIMDVLKGMGTGVQCKYDINGCVERPADSIFCPEDESLVSCQIFSWLPWETHQYKVPHWGRSYLHEGKAALKYGFTTRDIVENSWKRYKAKRLERNLFDVEYEILHSLDRPLNRQTPVHLPVCWDSDGTWELGALGPDPLGPKKEEKQKQKDIRFTGSCGSAGTETLEFALLSGILQTSNIKHIQDRCRELPQQRQMLSRDPWEAYEARCHAWDMSNATDPHRNIMWHDTLCDQNIKARIALTDLDKLTPVQASCFLCAKSTEFALSQDAWDLHLAEERDWSLKEHCGKFIEDKRCWGTEFQQVKPNFEESARCFGTYNCGDKWIQFLGHRQGDEALKELARACQQIPDDRTYASREYIIEWKGVVVWYEALGAKIQDKTRTGKQFKEDMHKLFTTCPKNSCGSILMDEQGDHFSIHADYLHDKFWECQGICDGQGPSVPIVNPVVQNETEPVPTVTGTEGSNEFGCLPPKVWRGEQQTRNSTCNGQYPTASENRTLIKGR